MTLPAPTGDAVVRWRYHFTDMMLGRLLATLPMTAVSLEDVLSAPAAGQGSVNLTSAAVRSRDPFRATVPRRSVCWAERQLMQGRRLIASDVLWSGIVMRRERSLSGRSMRLGMVTWPSYFGRKLLTYDRFYRQVDKLQIFRNLAVEGVGQPNVEFADPADNIYGGIRALTPIEQQWNAPTPASGVLADRTYLASDLKPVLEAMTELSSSGVGFDWRMAPYLETPGDLSTFRMRLEEGYPRLGRVQPPDLRWSTDPEDVRQRWGYIEDLTVVEDGSAVNNAVVAVGSGTGDEQLRARAADLDELRSGYPLYEGTVGGAGNDDRTMDTVYGKAQGQLLAGFASEVQVSGIKVRGDVPPVLTSYTVGDDITVKVGESVFGRPTTIVGQLIGRKIEPADRGGTEQVTLDVQGQVAA